MGFFLKNNAGRHLLVEWMNKQALLISSMYLLAFKMFLLERNMKAGHRREMGVFKRLAVTGGLIY